MKKLFAILLAALLAFAATGAMAETVVKLNENDDSFDMTLSVPNGMAVTQTPMTLGVSGDIEVSEHEALKLVFALTPDDSYDGLKMEDLSAEDVQLLFGLTLDDAENGKFETKVNAQGMTILTMEDAQRAEHITLALYDGYFFYMEAYHEDFSPLDDEECAIADSLADTLTVAETAK